jgi:tellurite resistance protein TehA-like permease
MLLFALVTVLLLFWALILSGRTLYMSYVIKDLKKKLASMVPLDPFTTALAAAQLELVDDSHG